MVIKTRAIVIAIGLAVVAVTIAISIHLHREGQREQLSQYKSRVVSLELKKQEREIRWHSGLQPDEEAELAELRRRIAAMEIDGVGK